MGKLRIGTGLPSSLGRVNGSATIGNHENHPEGQGKESSENTEKGVLKAEER